MTLPIDRFCNAILYWCFQRVEDKQQFMFQLERPIPGVRSTDDGSRELDDFASFMTMHGG